MKHIFFKSVRKDGSSLYAIGKYKQKYQIGKTYTFNEKTPAHVFVVCRDIEYDEYRRILSIQDKNSYNLNDVPLHDQELIYKYRAESSVAEKVLICYGELAIKKVPVCNVDQDWNFNNSNLCFYYDRFASTSFTVIGQIIPIIPHVAEPRIRGLKIIKDIS